MQRRGDLNQRERERERRRQRDQTTRANNKKQVRGGGLGKMRGKMYGSMTWSVARKRTQGEPQTTTRLVFPQRLKRRKKRDATTANKKQPDNKRRERDPRIILTEVRSSRADKSGQISLLPSEKHILNPQVRKNNSQNPKAESKIWEAKDRRGGGAHGPPRDLQRSILRVLDTEDTQGRTAFKIAVSKIYRNDTYTLKVSGPTLSRPSSAIVQERIHKIQREQKTEAKATPHATQAEKGRLTHRQRISGPLSGGDHEEVVGPIFPPQCSGKSQISGLRGRFAICGGDLQSQSETFRDLGSFNLLVQKKVACDPTDAYGRKMDLFGKTLSFIGFKDPLL